MACSMVRRGRRSGSTKVGPWVMPRKNRGKNKWRLVFWCFWMYVYVFLQFFENIFRVAELMIWVKWLQSVVIDLWSAQACPIRPVWSGEFTPIGCWVRRSWKDAVIIDQLWHSDIILGKTPLDPEATRIFEATNLWLSGCLLRRISI